MKNAVIIGRKVYLRPIEERDIYSGWLDWVNDPKLTEKLYINPPITEAELNAYYQKIKASDAKMFAVCAIENDEYIGNAKLDSFDWTMKAVSCGRLIGKSKFTGQGIGTEVLKLLQKYVFEQLGMHRIQTGVVASNIASIKSNEKAGMKREGLRKKAVLVNGNYEDLVLFGLIKEDFLQENKFDSIESVMIK